MHGIVLLRHALKGGEVEWVGRDFDGFWLSREAILEVTVADNRIQSSQAFESLFFLHLDLIRSFTARNGNTVAVENRTLFGLPAATTRGFANETGAAEGIGV